MGYSWTEKYIKEAKSAIASVRMCSICGHIERIECGRPNSGRGYGMREGNKARGRIIQHIKAKHPEYENKA